METVYKNCSLCGENKQLSVEFFTQKFNTKNGIKTPYWYNFCKICEKSKDKVFRKEYYDKNKNDILQKKKVRYIKNKEENNRKAREYQGEEGGGEKLHVITDKIYFKNESRKEKLKRQREAQRKFRSLNRE